jgi:hypothetical protein
MYRMVFPLVPDPPFQPQSPPDLQVSKILFLSEAPIYLNSAGQKKLQIEEWLISATPYEFNHLRP